MSEENMVKLMEDALAQEGIHDTILAAGQFAPRGQSGAMLAGGLIGGDVGGVGGAIGEGVGMGLGLFAGKVGSSKSAGLPSMMLVGASATKVYGMHAHSRRSEPSTLLFAVDRAGLTATVHQRVNVRVLELIHADTQSRIELEGSRVPLTHSKDVMDLLTQDDGQH